MKSFLKKLNDTDIRHIIAVMVVIGVFTVLILQHFVKIPEPNVSTVQRSTDQILALGFGVVLGFMFTSQKINKPTEQNKEL
jgi:hypothetical protein